MRGGQGGSRNGRDFLAKASASLSWAAGAKSGRIPRGPRAGPWLRILRDPLEMKDGEVPAAPEEPQLHLDPTAWESQERGHGRCTRRPGRPSGPRLDPGLFVRRRSTEVDLVGCSALEVFVRALLVVPAQDQVQLAPEGLSAQGNHDPPQPLLQGPDEPFQPAATSAARGACAASTPTPTTTSWGGCLRRGSRAAPPSVRTSAAAVRS